MNDLLIEKSLVFSPLTAARVGKPADFLVDIKTEVVRKSIHFLVALTPGMALVNYPLTVLALMTGVLGYTLMEQMRLAGVQVPLVSTLTCIASRSRDMNRFVLGPVTLGIGALLALLLFPSPAACIGIYALAFGDGFASLVGKMFGKIRPALLLGKSVEGSMACFTAVFISAWLVSRDYTVSLIAAVTATIVEALPLKDYDNVALPLIVGAVVQQAMLH